MRLISLVTAAAIGLVAAAGIAHAQATPPAQKSDTQATTKPGDMSKPMKASKKAMKSSKKAMKSSKKKMKKQKM